MIGGKQSQISQKYRCQVTGFEADKGILFDCRVCGYPCDKVLGFSVFRFVESIPGISLRITLKIFTRRFFRRQLHPEQRLLADD